MPNTKQKGAKNLTEEAFVKQAIVDLRNDGYLGIHTVYSGFNAAFRKYFGEKADPVEATNKLANEGKIVVRGAKGGVVLYLPHEAPPPVDNSGDKALQKMGLVAKAS